MKYDSHDNKPPTLFVISILMLVFIGGVFVYKSIVKNNLNRGGNIIEKQLQEKQTSVNIPNPTPLKLSADTKKWLLATSAVLSYRNGERLDTLDCGLPGDDEAMILRDWWGVTGATSAAETLEWLKYEGHSRSFSDLYESLTQLAQNEDQYQIVKTRMLKEDTESVEGQKRLAFALDFIWKNKEKFKGKKLYAWDYMRMANVARWSYSAGYITEETAWQYMYYGSVKLQKTYASWEELGEHYILGRTFWNGSTNHSDISYGIRWLSTNVSSPWKTNDWYMILE